MILFNFDILFILLEIGFIIFICINFLYNVFRFGKNNIKHMKKTESKEQKKKYNLDYVLNQLIIKFDFVSDLILILQSILQVVIIIGFCFQFVYKIVNINNNEKCEIILMKNEMISIVLNDLMMLELYFVIVLFLILKIKYIMIFYAEKLFLVCYVIFAMSFCVFLFLIFVANVITSGFLDNNNNKLIFQLFQTIYYGIYILSIFCFIVINNMILLVFNCILVFKMFIFCYISKNYEKYDKSFSLLLKYVIFEIIVNVVCGLNILFFFMFVMKYYFLYNINVIVLQLVFSINAFCSKFFFFVLFSKIKL